MRTAFFCIKKAEKTYKIVFRAKCLKHLDNNYTLGGENRSFCRQKEPKTPGRFDSPRTPNDQGAQG
jgi:hypothetical protein